MSKQNPALDLASITVTVLVAAIAFIVVSVAAAVLPFLLAIWLCWRFWRSYYDSPTQREKRAREQCFALYHAVRRSRPDIPDEKKFVGELYRRWPSLPEPLELALISAALDLYRAEHISNEIPEPPPVCDSVEGARYRDRLNGLALKLADPATVDIVGETILSAFKRFVDKLPEFRTDGEVWANTPILTYLPDPGEAIEHLAIEFYSGEAIEYGLFNELREQLDRNLHEVSGVHFSHSNAESANLVMPTSYKGDNPVFAYLKQTPLQQIFETEIPFAVPLATRFEHHHIIAGSGHGKTQTLQHLIANDLDPVAKGDRSVVVIDSQGDLIRKIAGLQVFAEGNPLHDHICIVDPTDIEWPVSLNLFDVGRERLQSYPLLERERLTNSILELYDFVLGSLLSAEMTQKQSVIFRYVTRLMLHIPDATIHTLRELMEKGSEVRFAEHIARLDGTARHFFETEFSSKEFAQTRQQVLRRLWGILENRTFERMFSHPRSKLDLFSEMNAGKVILINTAKDLLKESGTEIFGRFFIAMIAQAAQERATQPETDRMPTIVYIDEAADYFDRNIGIILSQARKYNVGMVLAHQYLGQLDPKLQEAFSANTAIKFAGGFSGRDAKAASQMLNCDPALIDQQPKGSFAAYLRGITPYAIPLRFPFGTLEDLPRMSDDDRAVLRKQMRERYAIHYSDLMNGNDTKSGDAQQRSSDATTEDNVIYADDRSGSNAEQDSKRKADLKFDFDDRDIGPDPFKDGDSSDTSSSPRW